ncbi:hypothetical protein Efla_000898 [Eimeria flavescens]
MTGCVLIVALSADSSPVIAPTMVLQPLGGGALYWGLRSFFQTARRRAVRYGRLMDMNWDYARACMNGTPKFSYDPSVNEWKTGVDNEHWNGPGGMVWSSISMNFIWWSFWAFWVYFTIARWYVNGKVDTFTKWRNRRKENSMYTPHSSDNEACMNDADEQYVESLLSETPIYTLLFPCLVLLHTSPIF